MSRHALLRIPPLAKSDLRIAAYGLAGLALLYLTAKEARR